MTFGRFRLVTTADADSDVLRQPCEPVTAFDGPQLAELAAALIEGVTVLDGAGLAAPQLGSAVQVFALAKSLSTRQVFVNPVLEPYPDAGGGMTPVVGTEACLSLPDYSFRIVRLHTVKVSAADLDGNPFQCVLRGAAARAAQHERDHLNGVLIDDERAGLFPAPQKVAPR